MSPAVAVGDLVVLVVVIVLVDDIATTDVYDDTAAAAVAAAWCENCLEWDNLPHVELHDVAIRVA